MACKYTAPNGNKSKLYDSVYKVHGHKTALKAWATSQTPTFKDWYTGKLDSNGEAIVTDNLYFLNLDGETKNLEIFNDTGGFSNSAAIEQIETLTTIFEDLGLDIDVKFDTNILDAGQVFTINGKTTVKFNSKNARKDSVFHEFSHLFVDLLQNDRVLKKGIENLRGSELWKQVAALYKELNDEQLGKEVLTTAIGIEAQKLYDERVKIRNLKKGTILDKIKGWAAWFSNAIRMIGVNLGINDDTTLKLAYALTGSKKRFVLTGKLSSKVQKQKTDISDLIKRGEKLGKTEDESSYIIPKELTKDGKEDVVINRVTTAIDELRGIFDKDSVIESLLKNRKGEWANFVSKEDLETFWADKREEGTGIHNITEDYIKARTAGKSREDSINAALSNLYKPEGGLDADGIRFYSGMDQKLVKGYINNIADFIESLIEKDYELFPEVKVFDEEMGVGGTIDLLIRRPDGKYMIYDWKTKEYGKFDDFYQYKYKKDGSKKMFKGFIEDMEYTSARSYSLQLSTYQLILERQGFEFVKDNKQTGEHALAIIPLEGIAQKNEKGETRYADVAIASEEVQGLNKDGVLPLESMMEKMLQAYMQGEDLEKASAQLNESIKTQNDLKVQIDRDTEVQKWLEEAIINLQKSVTVAKASGIGERAAKYKKTVEKLIEQMSVADENLAIIAYNKFITRGLLNITNKFNPGVVEVKNEETNEIEIQKTKGYSNYKWQDIKELEEKNPKGFIDFMAFMVNVDMFMSQVIQIDKLPSIYGDGTRINPVFQDLKRNLDHISNLKWRLKMLNQQLDLRYQEISSNPLSGGRGVLNTNIDFFEAQRDLSLMQHNMDSLADTHNRYFANVMRAYAYKKREMDDETKAMTEQWLEKLKELEASGSSLDKFIDKSTGKVITDLDYDRFKAERDKAFKDAAKYKTGTKAYRDTLNDFYDNNVEERSDEERQIIMDEKRKELENPLNSDDTRAYDKWLNTLIYFDPKGNRIFKKSSVMYKPKESVYGNEDYNNLTASELEFHKYLTSVLAYLTEHTKSSMVSKGYLPAVPKNMKGFMEEFAVKMGWRKTGDYDQTKGVATDVNNEIVHFIPFMFNNLLNQKELHEIHDEMSIEDKRKYHKLNEEIRKENKEAHAAAIELDLSKTMPIFIKTALNHKHKKAMEFELLRVKRSFIENHQILTLKNNAPIKDKAKWAAGYEDHLVKSGTKGSRILDRYNDWLRMIFYEEFENDEGTMQKALGVLQNYTSLKSMAFNPYSSLNNQVYGELMSKIEAVSSEFFSSKDWRKAAGTYTTGIISYFADDEASFNFSSKQSAFMHHIPILMDFKELAGNENQSDALGNVMLNKMGIITNKAFMFEHMSEHNLQNRTLLAMAYSHRVVNGRIMKFNEFVQDKLTKITKEMINADPENVKKVIAENKKKRKELKAEFEKFDTLYDSYEFTDGKLKLKKGTKLKKDEIAEFQMRVLGVNQYLHGIYNKEDAGALQKYALGRLAMQFRKWMRPGWTKRFGSTFGKTEWNERRSHYDEGMYVTTWNFLTRPIQENIALYKESQENKQEGEMQITALKAIGNIIGDYTKFIGSAKLHWHTLNETQKANVKRTVAEYGAFAMALGLLSLAKYLKGDDDEPPFALVLTLYQLDRTVTELTTYMPIAVGFNEEGVFMGGGWINESKKLIKNPLAAFKTMEDILRLSKEVIAYPITAPEDLEYQGGVYYGENKLSIHAQKLVPVWSQKVKTDFMHKNYKFYKLY